MRKFTRRDLHLLAQFTPTIRKFFEGNFFNPQVFTIEAKQPFTTNAVPFLPFRDDGAFGIVASE